MFILHRTSCLKVTAFQENPWCIGSCLNHGQSMIFLQGNHQAVFRHNLTPHVGFHTWGKQPLPHPLPPLSSASQSGEDLAHEALVKTLLDHFVLSNVWHLGQTKNSSGGLPYEVIVLWRCSITFWLWLCISETPSAVGTIQARCQVQCHGSVSVVPEWGLGEVGIYMYLSSSIA